MTQQQNPGLSPDAQQDPSERVQDAMLRMAYDLQQKGHVNEATDLYFQLLQTYPGTKGAQAAANAVVELGKYLEANGMPHSALHLYRKLEELQ